MLLITRRVGEKIMVGDDVVFHVKEIVGNTVRVGIEAPRSHADLPRGDLERRPRREPRRGRSAVRAPRADARRLGRLATAPRCARATGYGLGNVQTSPRPPATSPSPTSRSPSRATASPLNFPVCKPRRRRPGKKSLLLGGVAAAAAAALLLKRDKVIALLPGGRGDEPAPPEPAYTPPPVSNYDASGPVANTATAVPVPPAYEEPAIDEAAEEAAAAAEAANIGGSVSDYAGPDGEYATDAEAPAGREPARASPRARSRPTLELREAAEGDERRAEPRAGPDRGGDRAGREPARGRAGRAGDAARRRVADLVRAHRGLVGRTRLNADATSAQGVPSPRRYMDP